MYFTCNEHVTVKHEMSNLTYVFQQVQYEIELYFNISIILTFRMNITARQKKSRSAFLRYVWCAKIFFILITFQ